MFDVGFSEILLIAVVALLVLGPERLPKAARFTGLWVRRARSQWDSVKTEFEREIAAEDLKRSIDSARRQASEVAQQMGSVEDGVRQAAPASSDAPIAAAGTLVANEAAPVVATTAADAEAAAAAPVIEPGRSVSLEDPVPGTDSPKPGERHGG
ncbi:Sec-independent protein translocase protein TatB [Stenotrophomonas ginsengisoli]|uniref:Sec-independent protein translocase protein TatB n=1 Tax=Stenotrophomonas ginsengisoli TaxID=336566 RepID=UPI0009FA51E6|nr:Sec-independent protein translocase protein TatB [Stenotrophomonas ginsengisoli]